MKILLFINITVPNIAFKREQYLRVLESSIKKQRGNEEIEMNNEDTILVKYCFSELEPPLLDYKSDYYTAIIKKLESEGIISDILEYQIDSPFGGEPETVLYTTEGYDRYVYKFSCKEIRGEDALNFNFSVSFLYETYNAAEILYVDISSDNYTFSTESDSNCLEVLKHKLRKQIKGGKNRYCLVDKQSAFYASQLYPQIHEIENFLRYYVNDVFVKIFGANWWNEAISHNIRENRKNRIEDTREYSGEYKDIQPYLLSLELNDLMEIANTKRRKWIPTYDCKIENILNHYSEENLMSLMNNQCEIKIDIWNMCFKKYLGEDFLQNYIMFEKRRNQVAHNKLLDFSSYKSILELCNNVIQDLKNAYQKFCAENISEEEQAMIKDYLADLAQQEEDEIKTLKSIAEGESGVKVHSKKEILELFDEVIQEIYSELLQIFGDRADIDFSEYVSINKADEKQELFTIHYRISERDISIKAEVDIDDFQGATSNITVEISNEQYSECHEISFVNGEYSYNFEQTSYMPETLDELNRGAVIQTKQSICDFIEEHFPNLKEEADIRKHLWAMGKEESITENDVFCYECGEEYICIDDEYAQVGTCLNCGAKNKIVYCTYCQCSVEAIDVDDSIEEPAYCNYCNDKLFSDD